MSRITAVLALACLASLLAACGGGGGGGVRLSMDQPSLDRADAQTAAPEGVLASAQEAATSLPRFGSVTQSSRNVSGVSTDAASAEFDGQHLTVRIERGDGSPLTLDTARDTEEIFDSGPSPVTEGRSYRSWGLLNVTGSGATLASVAADWRESDTVTDWLAGGYWLHFSGDVLSGNIVSVEGGAFVDGPELDGTPNLPTTGTASYQGLAAGLYTAVYGPGAQEITPGSHEIGEYEGDLTLTADFANGNVSGRIDNISIDGYLVDVASGRGESFEEGVDYQINLGEENINSDGTFSGDGVTVTSSTYTITAPSGSWGGKFSTINDSAGNPRLVAGTHGGNFTTSESGGITASFVGAFYGAKQ